MKTEFQSRHLGNSDPEVLLRSLPAKALPLFYGSSTDPRILFADVPLIFSVFPLIHLNIHHNFLKSGDAPRHPPYAAGLPLPNLRI